ncbi:MAG: hypothetical protein ACOVNL_05045 [Prochlorococcaceae cyanobacterium]|jgi:hypothetical protein
MDSRRLVVWISTGILGFQGFTLCFDLLNYTALPCIYVRLNGFDTAVQRCSVAPVGEPPVRRPRGQAGVLDPDAATPQVADSGPPPLMHPLALRGSIGSDRGRGRP